MTRPSDLVSEYNARRAPPVGDQAAFWDCWNRECRFRESESVFQARQREAAVLVARQKGLHGARILDVGCGIGWLGAALTPFGSVTAADLSPLAIAEGRRRYPAVQFVSGDFLAVELHGSFDFVVCADALAHIPDAPAAVAKIAGLLRPRGTFLLMLPNREVWRRRSSLERIQPGQFMRWPPLSEIRSWLRPHFKIDRIGSLEPGGDRGILWWVENRYVRGVMRRTIGGQRWRQLLESARLGRQWTILAERRPDREPCC